MRIKNGSARTRLRRTTAAAVLVGAVAVVSSPVLPAGAASYPTTDFPQITNEDEKRTRNRPAA
ncbi:hypothetical protein [Streptomyces lanatus]|uniref:Uncharacterized protein n=1 Tax=Streptomyces lanatus TaxID=66900 RepID=A0ABV1XLK8_9ACTN|nr:hypothetical protein [Streptomyces lanatus]GHG99237.1 hypothetical protein GCM10018780_25790 [Streptomyces lanatus]